MNDALVVNEIFFSIQGESSFAGLPCAFVRLARCNLRCTYCDTEYAFEEGVEKSVREVLEKILSFRTDLVEITGGEPLLQPAVYLLVRRLLDLGKQVLIETGGSVDVRTVDSRAVLIYDIKTPDSGMEAHNLWSNLRYLRPRDEVKFVIGSRQDYEWCREKLQDLRLLGRHPVLFSPVWGGVEARELAEWILQDGLEVRLQIQLHKLLWGPDARGV